MTDPAQPTDQPSRVREALAEVRRRAEQQWADRVRPRCDDVEATDVERLVHELGVHQVELEIQNEELRQAQAELEASRDRYLALYEWAPVAYVTTDAAGIIVDSNHMAQAMLGAPAHFLKGRLLSEYFAAGYRTAFQQACMRLFSAQQPPAVQLRLAPPHAKPLWVAVSAALAPVDGRAHLRIALLDQTEHFALHEASTRLAAIVSSSEDAIIGRDLDGIIGSWNDAAERLFGIDAADAVGHPLDIVVPPERRDEDRAMVRRVRSGAKVAPFEAEWRHSGGHPIPLMIGVSPIRDEAGRIAGLSLIARDITDRKRSERELHRRLRQLDVLAEAAQALIMADPDTTPAQHDLFDRVRLAVGAEIYVHYTMADKDSMALASHLGLSAQAAADMQTQRIDRSLCGLVATRRAPLIVEALQDSPLSAAERFKREGVRCYAGFPLITRGAMHGVAAFASTTRDHFHAGDLQVMQTICDQVGAVLERSGLLRELQAREQSLKAADRRKDDFIATLAHELRNPLAPIRNAVSILAASILPDPHLAWCRDVIERQVRQMTRLLDDLLDVSRVTRNKIELRRERIELRAVLDDALEATRPLIDAQRHTLTMDVPPEPIVLYGDATRLTQILGNLLNNAAKYTDAGGHVHVRVQREHDYVSIAVRDDGIGMDPRQANQVFDMFAQLAPAIERSRGGLGIGLSLCRGLVEMHGGRIEAHSAGPGLGSEFVVWLPLVHQTGDAQRDPAPAEASPALEGRRVLVVDDNADAARTLAAMLALHGIETRTAFGGREGLQVAEEWRPDAAIVDIGMPHFNGYELCRRLREQPWGASMRIVACTGWGQNEDRARARAAGFDLHLVKPIDPAALLDALAEGHPKGQAA